MRKTLRERALIAARDTLGPNLPTVLNGLSVDTVALGAFVMGYLAGYRAAKRERRK